MEWSREFTDLAAVEKTAPAPVGAPEPEPVKRSNGQNGRGFGVSRRLTAGRLRTAGVRSMAEELFAALDHALVPNKMLLGAGLGLVGGLAFLLYASIDPARSGIGAFGAALLLLLAGAVVSALVTQTTFVELSRLRPARLRESVSGLARYVVCLLPLYLAVIALGLLAVVFLRQLPDWLAENQWQESLSGFAAATTIVANVAIWPVIGLALLWAPAVIVEDGSLLAALRAWGRLVRKDFGRVFLFEALAVALGLTAALPFLAAMRLSAWFTPPTGPSAEAMNLALVLFGGVIAGLFAVYLIVANVFIYLNVRYEYAPRKK